MKGKSMSTKFLQNREFLQSKNVQLGELLNQMESPEQEHYEQYSNQVQVSKVQPLDSLSLLISRARKATNKKLKGYRKQRKPHLQQQQKGPFLTGVDAAEQEDKGENSPQIQTKDMLDEQVMSLLRKKTLQDEISLLRKQIKATNGTLQSYEKQVLQSKKQVSKLGDRYKSYFNLNLPIQNPTVDFSRYSLGMKSLKSLFNQKGSNQ